MTLYLKYRPKNLDQLDLPEVSESLKKIVNSGQIPHAFLFAGPKGTGKTSAARILAKIINCEKPGKDGTPCDKCDQCVSITKGSNLDVIELDAASHRGIDDVRVLRDAVKLSPTKAKKKIYIIDEAHMLTTEACNALLKTLEEPPEHVVFILATTNPEKLIDTIRSRTTLIPFRKANTEELVKSLRRVVEGEKVKADDAALAVIAKASGGAFRDAIKTLELLIAEERELSEVFLQEHLLNQKTFDVENFTELLLSKNLNKLLNAVSEIEKSGVAIESFTFAVLENLRVKLLSDISNRQTLPLIELFMQAYRNISESPIEALPLEVAIIKWCGDEDGQKDSGGLKETDGPNSLHIDDDKAEKETVNTPIQTFDTAELSTVNDDVWKTILNLVKPVNASIEALLRAARPVNYDGKTLTLGVYYKFHKERLEDVHHRIVLEDIVGKVLKSPTKVVCALTEPPPKKIIEKTETDTILTEGKDQDIVKVAEEIFGN